MSTAVASRHPTLGRRTVDHAGRSFAVRRIWPTVDDVLALELVSGGETVGAFADGDGSIRVLDTDDALPSLGRWRARRDAAVIAHRPGKRAVVHVAPERPDRVYVKVAGRGATDRALARAAAVSAALVGVGGRPAMATVLDVDRPAGELTLGPLEGVGLTTILRLRGPGEAHRVGVGIGRMLEAIARPSPPGLVEHAVIDEVAVLDRWVDDAVRFGALTGAAADQVRRCRDEVVEQLLDLVATTAVLAHRDLHDGQIVLPVDPAAPIGVLDWDTASAAPPGLDVGNLLAHLDRLGAVVPAARAVAAGVVDGARAAGHPAWTDGPQTVAVWRAAAALRVAAVHAFRC